MASISRHGTSRWNSTPAPRNGPASGARNCGSDVPRRTFEPARDTQASGSPLSGGVSNSSCQPARQNMAAARYGSSVARIGVSTTGDYARPMGECCNARGIHQESAAGALRLAPARGDAMSADRARLVTVSASYGAGGAVVAPALAERLGVPFLQRATTSTGGSSGPEPCFERLGPEEARLTPAHRLLASLMQTVPLGPTQSPIPVYHQDEDLRQHCEEGIRRLAAANAGVILGRG